MRGERPAWCSQQHVVIVGGDERADGDETVSARAILDDDRLAPAPAQSICDQARADIDTATGSERHDELDRPLRPGLRGRWLCREDKHGEKGDAKCKTLHAQQRYKGAGKSAGQRPPESRACREASRITSNS